MRYPARVATEETIAVRLGLHQVAGLRWPKDPVTGNGPRQQVSVPLPRLPWSSAAIEVPLGASAARDIARVSKLRKIFGYGIAPAILVIFIAADVLLIWAHYGSLRPPGALFAILALVGVALILTGLIPDTVARLTGTPYVSRNQLRLPAARLEVVQQLARLNPKVEIAGLPPGDLSPPR